MGGKGREGAEWGGGGGRMGGGGAVEGDDGDAEETAGAGLENGCGDIGQDAEWAGRTMENPLEMDSLDG